MRRSPPSRPHRPWIATLVGLAALTLPSLTLPAIVHAEPWPVEPLAADIETFRAWTEAAETAIAETTASDTPVVVLWRDDQYRFDATGRLHYRRHWVYRLRHPSALDAWSTSEARWSPWHQNPPQLTARVLTAEGNLLEVPAPQGVANPDLDPLGDQRQVVRLPLPATSVGAVVEEVLTLSDREPLFRGGVSFRHPLVLPVPIHRGRLVLEAPTTLSLRFGVLLAPDLEPTRTVADGRVRLVFDYGPLGPASPVEPWQPSDAPRYPHVAFSTGTDWESVGAAYVSGLEGALPPPEAPAGVLTRGTLEERVEGLLATLRRRVRPLPRSLAATPSIPRAPSVTLEHGHGDSQDLAALLVSWLRSQDIPAYVALVAAGHGHDVEPRLPGLGLFDRALVYIPEGQALWIDPVDPWTRVGELAAESRNRWALVASPTVRQLIRTPTARAEDNHSEVTVDIELADSGPARIVERATYTGDIERAQRRLAASLQLADRQQAYGDYVRTAYLARELGAWSESDPGDLAEPYQLEVEALGAERGYTDGDVAAVAIQRRDLLVGLPPELLLDSSVSRRTPFVFRRPFSTRRTFRIRPAAGFRPTALPENQTVAVGSGQLEQRFEVRGGSLVATLSFNSGPAEISAETVERYRHEARRLLLEEPLVIELRRGN